MHPVAQRLAVRGARRAPEPPQSPDRANPGSKPEPSIPPSSRQRDSRPNNPNRGCRRGARRNGSGSATPRRSSGVRRARDRRSDGAPAGSAQGRQARPHRDYLLALIEATPDLTISELLAKLLEERQVRAARARLWVFLDCCGLTFKNVWPAPSARGLSGLAADQSASTYPASEISSRPRWRYARSGPHKSLGVERRFLNQASGTPFDCQALSWSPSRKPHRSNSALEP
jgi:transposase